MIILHASWLEGRLNVWGEQPPATESDVPRRRGRKPVKPKVMPSPYDADISDFLTVLRNILVGTRVHPGDLTICWAWLPTVAGVPLASDPIISEPLDTDDEPELLPWKVIARPLAWDETRNLLAACMQGSLLSHGVVAGHDAIAQ